MTDALHLGWAQGEAQNRASRYRAALAIYLFAYAIAGLLLVVTPSVVGHILALPPHRAWLRPIGGLILTIVMLQLPAWQDARRSRVTALAATLGRFLLAILWLTAGGPLIWVGLFEAVCAVGLAVLLYRYFTAELMSRP